MEFFQISSNYGGTENNNLTNSNIFYNKLENMFLVDGCSFYLMIFSFNFKNIDTVDSMR
jgi:hypothetical protein